MGRAIVLLVGLVVASAASPMNGMMRQTVLNFVGVTAHTNNHRIQTANRINEIPIFTFTLRDLFDVFFFSLPHAFCEFSLCLD